MIRVKICGITNGRDARGAVASGADALGFVFADSPRRADEKIVAKIVRGLGKKVAAIGVFVDEPPERLFRIAESCALNMLQFHGQEKPALIRKAQRRGFQVLKAVRVGEKENFKKLSDDPADAWLFDTSVSGRFGGTGKTFDWEILKNRSFDRPWFVSGGLNAHNVKKLLSTLRPYGVDVSSGVENAPGKKNHKLVKEFIRNAKSAG